MELLVTIGIMGFLLTGLLQFFMGMAQLNALDRDMTLAVSHAQYILEDIRSSSGVIVNQIAAGQWDLDTDAEFSDAGLMRLQGEEIDVTATGTGPSEITVTVSWKAANGRPFQAAFYTADAGL